MSDPKPIEVKRTEYKNKIKIQIELLKANLAQFDKDNKKTDWSVIGSLCFVHDALQELNKLFSK
jgi:hypothetical protein